MDSPPSNYQSKLEEKKYKIVTKNFYNLARYCHILSDLGSLTHNAGSPLLNR